MVATMIDGLYKSSQKKEAMGLGSSSKVCWNEEEKKGFLRICTNFMRTPAICVELETRGRSGTGTEDLVRSCGKEGHASCGDSFSSGSKAQRKAYNFVKKKDDYYGKILQQYTQECHLETLLGRIAEKASNIYENIIRKGKADGLSILSIKEEMTIRKEVLKESLISIVLAEALDQRREAQLRESYDAGFYAHPSSYEDGNLDALKPEVLEKLMKTGFATQKDFLGEAVKQKILEELKFYEADGAFNSTGYNSSHKTMWLTLDDIDRQRCTGLLKLAKCFQALPYELNKKANLRLQVESTMLLSLYSKNSCSLAPHLDNGYARNLDNGRSITCTYYPNQKDWKSSDGGYLRMYQRINRKQQEQELHLDSKDLVSKCFTDILPVGDSLLIFRSRDMPHEICESLREIFDITFWISGPILSSDN